MRTLTDRAIEFRILKICKQPHSPTTLTNLLFNIFKEKYNVKSFQACYHRIYRILKRLEAQGLIKRINPNSKPALYATTQAGLDLISSAAKLKPSQNNLYSLPLRARQERKSAIKLCMHAKMLNADLRELINEKFDEYLDFCDNSVIILKKTEYGKQVTEDENDYLIIKYKTRFNDEQRSKRLIAQYHDILNRIPEHFKTGVHLTVTTDPKRFSSLWEANRHFSKAFNRFLSRLRKIFGHRPYYIACYEFTQTGLLHAHILFFGRPYLLPKRQITRIWSKCGQGEINYIYKIQRQGNSWIYARKRPKDAKKGQTADDYLKKYIIKALYGDEAVSLYWVFNKRFYTFSYRLLSNSSVKIPPSGIWQFFFTCFTWDIPHAIYESAIFINC